MAKYLHRFFRVQKEQFGLNINTYKCDYEIAAIHAVKEVVPDVLVKGCYYHFQNANWRMTQKIDLSDSREGKKVTHLFILLPLLPPIIIPEAYLGICEITLQNESFTKFKNYFDNQLLMKITSDVFSCHGKQNGLTDFYERGLNFLDGSWHEFWYFFLNRVTQSSMHVREEI